MDAAPHGRIVVVGGANSDIVGHSFAQLIAQDSNPGYVRRSPGGVARNVAENLARLGLSTSLVTAFGNDADADHIRASCTAVGIDLTGSITAPVPGSVYLAILDDGGDMALALSDARALDRLRPAVLEDCRELLDSADILVADGNLPIESVEWLASEAKAPIIFDPVSTTKALRGAPVLSAFSAVKCNAAEAAALLGVGDPHSLKPSDLAGAIVAAGAGSAFVTAGAAGTWFADPSGTGHLPAPSTAVANATGAGDAFTAGVAAAMLLGATPRHAAALGSILAGITLGSEHTVCERVTPEVLAEEAATWHR